MYIRGTAGWGLEEAGGSKVTRRYKYYLLPEAIMQHFEELYRLTGTLRHLVAFEGFSPRLKQQSRAKTTTPPLLRSPPYPPLPSTHPHPPL